MTRQYFAANVDNDPEPTTGLNEPSDAGGFSKTNDFEYNSEWKIEGFKKKEKIEGAPGVRA